MGNKVEEARNKAVEDHTAGTRAKQIKDVVVGKPGNKKTNGKTPKRPPRGRKVQSSSEEEEKKSKFQVVQRYKNSQPLTLRPD